MYSNQENLVGFLYQDNPLYRNAAPAPSPSCMLILIHPTQFSLLFYL